MNKLTTNNLFTRCLSFLCMSLIVVSAGAVEIQENTSGFCHVDGSIDSNNSGYTGAGFANTKNMRSSGIDWAIKGDAGIYTLEWRFANGKSSNRLAELSSNGDSVVLVDFFSTGSWTSWNTTSVAVDLNAGFKKLRLEAFQSSGLANIDWIKITGPNVSAASNCDGAEVTGSACTVSQGLMKISDTIYVEAGEVFDGGCKTYLAGWGQCNWEVGASPVFRIEAGGTLRNVIIGPNGGDGIQTRGDATLENISWSKHICGRGINVKREGSVTVRNITVERGREYIFGVSAKSNVKVYNAKLNDMLAALRENGGHCYPAIFHIEDAVISNVYNGVFRSDCDESEFSLKNVELYNVPSVCYGDYKSCIEE